MIITNQPRYLLVVRSTKGAANLLIDVVKVGTAYNVVCTITAPLKWPSMLDADLIPEFRDNPLLAGLPEYEKRGLVIQIDALRRKIVANIAQSLQTEPKNP